jgi:hypothetical protein
MVWVPAANWSRPSSVQRGFVALPTPLTFLAGADPSTGTSHTSDCVPLLSSMRVLTMNDTHRASGDMLGAATVLIL